MPQDPFSHQIIGLAMQTHHALGPGLIEEFYHQDLISRLTKAGIEHLSKPRRDLIYRGFVADTFEADLVLPGKLIPELKVLSGGFSKEHFTQILVYNKFWRIRHGMLLDFGKASMIPKRVIYSSNTASFQEEVIPSYVTDPDLARCLIEVAKRCLSDVGLGYRPTTWRGLMSAALQAEGVPFVMNPLATVAKIGQASLACLAVNGKAAVAVSALGEEVTAMNRARLQTCLRWLNLPWGICFHFGKSSAELMFVSAPKNQSVASLNLRQTTSPEG
jgi:GxxExxY protein